MRSTTSSVSVGRVDVDVVYDVQRLNDGLSFDTMESVSQPHIIDPAADAAIPEWRSFSFST